MKTAIINIELNRDGQPSTRPMSDYLQLMERIRLRMPRSVGELQTARYTSPDGLAIAAPVAVVTVQYYSDDSLFMRWLHDLAAALGEDCAAVLMDGGDGFLVGPGAAKWGAFDIKQFRGPAVFAHLMAA